MRDGCRKAKSEGSAADLSSSCLAAGGDVGGLGRLVMTNHASLRPLAVRPFALAAADGASRSFHNQLPLAAKHPRLSFANRASGSTHQVAKRRLSTVIARARQQRCG